MKGVAQNHAPVLLHEALAALDVQPAGCYVDGTFGRGGHSRAILSLLDAQGCVLALDKDQAAIRFGRQHLKDDSRLILQQQSFAQMRQAVEQLNRAGQVNGVLLDLGVSSPQLDEAERGFSFQQDGPLDMRMDQTAGKTAAQWLMEAAEKEIARVLWEYGEERFSRRIAKAIVAAREQMPLSRTGQLATLIAQACPVHDRHKHPATRSFQAIRIYINREMDDLKQGLQQALDILASGGRLVVISFHSLEDRIVKRFMREQARGEILPKGVPVLARDIKPGRLIIIGKPIRAGAEEVAVNPRARSAIMRVAVKS